MSHSSYCPNCGTVNSPDSIFCEQCGYQMLAGNRGKQTSSEMVRQEKITKPAFSSELRSERRHFRRYRNRRSHKGAKIAFLAIFLTIIIIGGAMLILPRLDTSYNYLGTNYMSYHRYDNPAMTEAEFIIDNAVGLVHIYFVENSSETDLVMITSEILGRQSVSIDGASQFETYSYENRTIFMFNSVDRLLSDSKWYDYQYNIEIWLNTQISGSFNIHVSSGEINFQTDENARVNELLLDTTAGDISTYFYDTTFLNTQEFNTIKTVSGTINSHFINLKAENTTSWDISSVSGSIYVDMDFASEPPEPRQMNFDVESISGEITYEFSPYFLYNSSEELSLGYTIDVNTFTGDIALIDLGNYSELIEFPYTTINYGFALLNFDLTFTTVSGSITIFKN
ncbi:MAG: zinc ribbon domain-containing protein [Candidatus Heimdallarchaeota archaeon]|nr:zinc ribbon domain-containing protein [Candidatus Heimdallarchaeota archaeon]